MPSRRRRRLGVQESLDRTTATEYLLVDIQVDE
jgi:hypothetical protein